MRNAEAAATTRWVPTATAPYQTLISFTNLGIPAGSAVNSATLTINVLGALLAVLVAPLSRCGGELVTRRRRVASV
jgi:hypothetical protein